ncbi:hypothetical protein LCGC14_1457140 [marine sediment metagenome]|uniref:RNA polymerase alpha subunit C-terminal domain-containing protein n=1 Tax=marine sediment metagenome TaxID=412755 RepID=A0A0F9K2D2_9ZZZZ
MTENGMALWQKSECARITGKISAHATMALGKGYQRGDYTKPLDELTDDEVLAALNCGPATLRELRSVFPAPSG